MVGGDDISLLYIAGSTTYRSYIEDKPYRYLFKIFLPILRPRILDELVIQEKNIGDIAGINLRDISYEKEDYLGRYLEAILKVKREDHKYIFIEELEFSGGGIIKYIEDYTSLRFPTGKEIRLYNLPFIIEELGKNLHRNFQKEEILLISNNKEEIIDTIYSISHIFNFISIIGIDDEQGEEIYDIIFENTGLSIFQPKNVDNILKDYGVIVNLEDRLLFDEKNINRKTIIFDFSISRPLRTFEKNQIIYDIKLDTHRLGTLHGFKMDACISSRMYECIFGREMARCCGIVARDNFYNIDEYAESNIRIKGKL